MNVKTHTKNTALGSSTPSIRALSTPEIQKSGKDARYVYYFSIVMRPNAQYPSTNDEILTAQ
jgi:hypothetical protein